MELSIEEWRAERRGRWRGKECQLNGRPAVIAATDDGQRAIVKSDTEQGVWDWDMVQNVMLKTARFYQI